MKLGKALSFISPAAGMLSGNGAGFLPYLSPGFGMLSGKGPFSIDDDDDPLRKLLSGGMMGGMKKGGMFGAGMPPMGLMGMFGGGG